MTVDLRDYRRWIVAEIRRIENNGAHEPWLTRSESIARLQIELDRLDRRGVR